MTTEETQVCENAADCDISLEALAEAYVRLGKQLAKDGLQLDAAIREGNIRLEKIVVKDIAEISKCREIFHNAIERRRKNGFQHDE